MRISIRYIILAIGLFCSLPSFSQNDDYDSVEQLVNDIKSRKFDKPIAFMRQHLAYIESDTTSSFPDSIYIGMTTLLASTYVKNNQPYTADSLLSHAINYLIETQRTSPLAYSLYMAYGGILMHLIDYNHASIYLGTVVQYFRDKGENGENYAVALSMLAECHRNLGSLEKSVEEIDEAIQIIKKSDGYYSLYNQIGIYQKAGAIYDEVKEIDKSEKFTKQSFDLSKDNENFVSEFINTARNLATIFINKGNYEKALDVLEQIERKPLSEIEKESVYNSKFLVNYFLNREEEAVKYVDLCSQVIRNNSLSLYSSFPTKTIDDYWEKAAMQLKVNMGILEKFSSNRRAIEMCYDNALFTKNLSFAQMNNLRNAANCDIEIRKSLSDVQFIKSAILSGNDSLFSELNQQEKRLISQIRKNEEIYNLNTWCDVKRSLKADEIAIEIITYAGFSNSDSIKNELEYGALILSSESDTPHFVKLCKFQSLYDVLLSALTEQEYGINQLYLKNGDNILYDLVWEKIEPFVNDAKTIFISPILDLKSINVGFIPCPDKKYLNEKYDIRIVSSTSNICKEETPFEFTDAAIYGGIEYTKDSKNNSMPDKSYRGMVLSELTDKTRGSFGYLHASEIEADSIFDIMNSSHHSTQLYKGVKADETSFRAMDGNAPSIIHMATHGFYLVGFHKFNDYFSKLTPYSGKDNTMLLSGLLLAYANTSFNNSVDGRVLSDGILTAEEISFLDLSKTKLVVLSACESAIGSSMQEGIGGLLRAFKNAGVKHIVASLWKVPDNATAKLMIAFYEHLVSGVEIHNALKKAQQEVSRQYPDPYYWASFILLD